MIQLMSTLPKDFVQSKTPDPGTEFTDHRKVKEALDGVQFCFPPPYQPGCDETVGVQEKPWFLRLRISRKRPHPLESKSVSKRQLDLKRPVPEAEKAWNSSRKDMGKTLKVSREQKEMKGLTPWGAGPFAHFIDVSNSDPIDPTHEVK